MKSVKTATGKKVRFELLAEPGSQVFVAGTFNNWNPSANPLKDNPESGLFKAAIHVPKGIHQYKFIVDGVWTGDPKCADGVPNDYGSHNNVLHIE
jgi:1,4-alpha-glucan branching enzyme